MISARITQMAAGYAGKREFSQGSGAVPAAAETSLIATACDWTWDCWQVVVSPGGK